jgi:alkylated DNA repair dioxygenase AlkB
MSVSLASPIVMDFKGPDAAKALVLPARSALVLHGPSRYSWQHGIANR